MFSQSPQANRKTCPQQHNVSCATACPGAPPLPDIFPASLPHPHFKMGGIRRHLAAGPSSWPAATSPLHGWAAPREPPRVRWPWQLARKASCRLLAPEPWAGTTRRPGWPKQASAAPRVGSRAVVAIRRQAAGPEVVASRGVTPLFSGGSARTARGALRLWRPAQEASHRLLAPESWAGTTRRPGWPKQAGAAPRRWSRAGVSSSLKFSPTP